MRSDRFYHQDSYYPGFPRSMGKALAVLFERHPEKRMELFDIIHDVQNEKYLLPLDADDDVIFNLADRAARVCHEHIIKIKMADIAIAGIKGICDRHGVAYPLGEEPREIIARAVSRNWWVRAIRKAHARRFEHVAIKLGFVGIKTSPYISLESAKRQAQRNRQNAKLLESTELQNEHGQTFTLAELSALGTSNKAIRRGELMTRIRGFEEVAQDLGHVGQFWTITCPSKFHAVGGENKTYENFTPREAQAYLVHVWALIRAKLHRQGIRPYGFRIAEPHTDGCPHWHLLLFVAPENALRMERIIKLYARYEDPNEAGAAKNRVKLVRIEAGKGTAAGYIAKYVSKNIDGEGVGDHTTRDNFVIAPDMLGKEEITASQRVTYWSQLHGIRQFQQIGGAPITALRELRRVKEETIKDAPEAIRAAWEAAQKREDRQVSFAAYIKAQGGVHVGRKYVVRVAHRPTEIQDRYTGQKVDRIKPCGVYHAANENKLYESVRYTWTVKPKEALAVDVPWTGVNNCTQVDYPGLKNRFTRATQKAAAGIQNQKISAPAWVDWGGIRRKAKEIEEDSQRFARARGNHG